MENLKEINRNLMISIKKESTISIRGWQRHARLWMILTLLITDVVCLFAAIVIAAQIRNIPGVIIDPNYDLLYIMLAATLVVASFRKGLYPAIGMPFINELRQIFSTVCFAFLLVIGFTFALKTTAGFSRLALVFTWGLTLGFIPVGRYFLRRLLIHLHIWGEPVAIIGNLSDAVALANYFKDRPQTGIRPVAVIQEKTESAKGQLSHTLLPFEKIREYAQSQSLSTILVLTRNFNNMDTIIDHYREVFQRVILIKSKEGRYLLNNLELLDFWDMMGLQVTHNLLDFWAQVTKRVIDVFASLLGLLALSPFFMLVSILIKIDSPGRIFYRQTRVGRGGRSFKILKFRSMHINADQILQAHLGCNPDLKKEWDQYQKLKDDPRVTRVGAILRHLSLDELPQLWNVFKGDMSLVGPRPIFVNQQKMYGVPIKDYLRVTPGMTGLWQVSGRNRTTFARRVELDNEYIQRWSIWLDIYILLETIKILVKVEGAY